MGFSLVPKGFYSRVTDIRPEQLTARGITLLLADLDNTLVPYKTPEPDRAIRDWKAQLQAGGVELFLLSNSRKPGRPGRFAKALGIDFVGHAGKPGVKGYREAMSRTGRTPEQTAIVGDQIFTDIYARNKDFLISDSVITFTDTNGKLMALKPDVTLSIVKNSKDTPDTVQKLYYTENVYRVAKGSRSFKELMQVGLECLGNIDDYCISEVLMLAAESLYSISRNSVLDISHLGLLSEVMDSVGIPRENREEILQYIGEKNQHELAAACRGMGVSEENIQGLRQLASIRGTPEQVLPVLKARFPASASLAQLERVCGALNDSAAATCIDFSVVDDIHYYNGIVFKGFIQGIAESVLSGGQYDKLMQKLKRKAGAIGFAVYMDLLERLEQPLKQYDVDVVLLYETGTALNTIQEQVKALTQAGCSVMVQPGKPENIKYKRLIKLYGSEVEILENNA